MLAASWRLILGTIWDKSAELSNEIISARQLNVNLDKQMECYGGDEELQKGTLVEYAHDRVSCNEKLRRNLPY